MARRYLNPNRGGRAFRPELGDLPAGDRVALAELLMVTFKRAAGSCPGPGTKPLLDVLLSLATSAAGDGPIEASHDLTEAQAQVVADVLAPAVAGARAAGNPAANLLGDVRRSWLRHARLPELEPVPAGGAW